jgi:hypothetical protein
LFRNIGDINFITFDIVQASFSLSHSPNPAHNNSLGVRLKWVDRIHKEKQRPERPKRRRKAQVEKMEINPITK